LLFAAACVVWKVVQHGFLGEMNGEKWVGLEDVTTWEKVTLWPLLLLVIVFGVYPAPLLDIVNAALALLLERLP
jgi:NADH-quinone oxidoreductase subunit M